MGLFRPIFDRIPPHFFWPPIYPRSFGGPGLALPSSLVIADAVGPAPEHLPAKRGPAPNKTSTSTPIRPSPQHPKEPNIHPYTPLVTAACLMVSVTVLNAPWASAIGVAVAVVASLIIRNKAATLAAVTIIIPACVSFSLMYGLFGSWSTAAALSLRFAAVVGCGVMFGSLVNPDALMRALQTWLPAPIVYVVGSVVRLIPLATSRMRTIQQIQRSRGVKPQRRKLVIPLVVGLVTDAAQRSRPLSRTGIAQPGQRTVLYPVRDRAWERVVRYGMVALMFAACVWGVAG